MLFAPILFNFRSQIQGHWIEIYDFQFDPALRAGKDLIHDDIFWQIDLRSAFYTC
jgi:hypothetical protein